MPRAGEAASRPFLDTNVLLYLLSSDAAKADRADALLSAGATIGVQVLNEFANVALRKLAMPWDEITEVLSLIRSRCNVVDLTAAVHDRAIVLARRHRFAWYDALIVAAAVEAGCGTLFSEDMHDGLKVEGALIIRNPFAALRG
jgi:predicted nucleic acid-binding protein